MERVGVWIFVAGPVIGLFTGSIVLMVFLVLLGMGMSGWLSY